MTSAAPLDALRPGGRAMRAVRSVGAGLVCVTTAAVGHHAAGGALPAPVVLAAFAGSAAVAWLLSSRRLTASQLLGLLALCQVGVHFTSGHDMAMGAPMLVAHAAATVLSLVVLVHGESFAWSIAERLTLRAAPLLDGPRIVPAVGSQPISIVAAPCRRVFLAYSRPLRGPPVGLV